MDKWVVLKEVENKHCDNCGMPYTVVDGNKPSRCSRCGKFLENPIDTK